MFVKDHSDNVLVTLAGSPFGLVQKCQHGCYHVHIQQITLHLSPQEFGALFEMMKQAKWREEDALFSSSPFKKGMG